MELFTAPSLKARPQSEASQAFIEREARASGRILDSASQNLILPLPISAEDSEWTNKEWMETNRWLDSRIAGEKGVSRGRKSCGAQAVRLQYGEERNILNQWTRKREKKERGRVESKDGRVEG